MAVEDARPEFGPLMPALEILTAGDFSDIKPFSEACEILCKLQAKADPGANTKINLQTSKTGRKLISVPGMEEVLTLLGWITPEAGGDGELLFAGRAVPDAVERIGAVSAWAQRRSAGVRLVSVTSDPQGWSHEFHMPAVLEVDPKFKGAVWDVSYRLSAPDGIVVFHNSPFSNWLPCGQQVQCMHKGRRFSFSTSEGLIMAFKEHLLAGTALEVTLKNQSAIKSPADGKAWAAKATRHAKDYSWWSHHGMHVLVGATACYLKFSQDSGLRQLLLSTQKAVLIETAPNDGAWGVATNSSKFLSSPAPESFALGSIAEDTLSFEVNGRKFIRKHGESNALGKSLMIIREMLLLEFEHPRPDVELADAVLLVCQQLECLALPFDWQSARDRLLSSW